MKPVTAFLSLAFLIGFAACTPLVDPNIVLGTPAADVPERTPQPFFPWSRSQPSANEPPAPNPLQDRYDDLHGTETAVGLQREQLERERAQLELQLMRDAATSTAGAQATSTAIAAAIATNVSGTQAAETQSTGTAQASGTQTAFPLTQTSLQATREVEAIRIQVEKVKAVVYPVLLAIAFVAFMALGWLWLRRIISAYHLQKSQIHPDEKGRFPAVPEDVIPGKSKRVVNMNLMHRAVHDPNIQDDLSTEQALANTHDQRKLETIRSIADSPAMPRIAAALLKPEPSNPATPTLIPLQGDEAIPMLKPPESTLLNQWDGKLLPYGADENQKLLTFDPAKRPHLMVTGTTGTGKTRYEIRTLVTGALASGWQVIAIGKQADYIPFQGHPNVKLIPANAIKEAEKYIRLLKAASEEMFKRDAMLTAKSISTWDRYGGPQTMIVVDDYSSAMMMMREEKTRKEVLSWALALAMDGRKYGLNLLLGLQRASWTCISTDLRSQMARITLRVESAHESRIVLGENGAESLQERQFLARLEEGSGLIRGAAFAMTDEETRSFLVSRPAREAGEMDWIDAVAMDVQPEERQTAPVPDDDQKIREVLTQMIRDDTVSLRQVEREVWGEARGGQYYEQVSRIYKALKANGATATTGKVPDSGAIAA